MTEFVALRPKVYSIKHQMLNECNKVKTNRKKTRKGVSKVVVKKEIKHGNYVTVIETNEIVKHEVVSIRSFNHQLYTFKQQQLALTLFYDKMQMLGNINCIPYGLSRNPKKKQMQQRTRKHVLSPTEEMLMDNLSNLYREVHKLD